MAKGAYLGDIEGIIAEYYSQDRKITGKDLTALVNKDKRLNGRTIPLSTIQAKLAKWHTDERKQREAGIPINPLDRPWNIGLSMKYGIPADIVPTLIDIKHVDAVKGEPTIRQARWLAYLKPILAPIIERKNPKYSSKQKLGMLVLITDQYSRQEQANEIITGEISPFLLAPDTTTLDKSYLLDQDVSEKRLSTNFWLQMGVSEIEQEQALEQSKALKKENPKEYARRIEAIKTFLDKVKKESESK